jgi:hypothetical protein
MSYENRALTAKCIKCGKEIGWRWEELSKPKPPVNWPCKCGWKNILVKPDEWPAVPRTLYLGHEKNQRLRIHPFPPSPSDSKNPIWAQPYSIRSFLVQASNSLGGCSYTCDTQGNVMDEIVFTDRCWYPKDESSWPESWPCHIAGGWTNGQITCPLWENIAKLCQTEPERRFLYQYLRFAKHRQFPMLLPQPAIGIGERKRPDFAVFVPLQYWNYKWLAIQPYFVRGNLSS